MRQSNIVTVTGTTDNVAAAVIGLQARVAELDKEQEDRVSVVYNNALLFP